MSLGFRKFRDNSFKQRNLKRPKPPNKYHVSKKTRDRKGD